MQNYMIKTKRLGLRPFQQSDIDYLAELNSDPDVRQFFPDGTQNREQTEARMNDFISYYNEKGLPCFVMFELESGEFVGRCGYGLLRQGKLKLATYCIKNFGAKDWLQRF